MDEHLPATCKHCKYHQDRDESTMWCRRHPPQLIESNLDDCNSTWPVVYATSWCGEWEARGSNYRSKTTKKY